MKRLKKEIVRFEQMTGELNEYKKCNILAYWINDFANYHDDEKDFDSTKLKRYKRGDIIKANLGFNVGR